ncbi:MAG: hypothetical protein GX444_17540 [Myxococcales bacterium]|nr:hypothetical protein [Myxococcales bacterium]
MKRRLLFLLIAALGAGLISCAASNDETVADHPAAASQAGDPVALDHGASAGADNNGGGKVCEPVAPPALPEPDIADPSVVTVDEDLFFQVDGQRLFPIGFYWAPEDLAGLQAYKEEGFNVALAGDGCCEGDELQAQLDILDNAQQAGVFIILRVWRPMDQVLTRPEEELAAELAARDVYGSLFGWYTFDEPGMDGTDKTETARAHEVLTTNDPDHLDLLVDTPFNDFSMYMDDCSVFGIDPYPSDWMPLSYVKASLLEALDAANGEKPVIGVLQGFSWDAYNGIDYDEYRPNERELRNMAWQYIVLGARGLLPWNYSADYAIRAQPEIWADFLETVGEINELAGVILTKDVTLDLAPEADFPTMFDYAVKQEDTASWILTVSTNERPMKVGLDLSALGTGLCIVDYTTGEVFVQDENGRIEVNYDSLQARVLEVLE